MRIQTHASLFPYARVQQAHKMQDAEQLRHQTLLIFHCSIPVLQENAINAALATHGMEQAACCAIPTAGILPLARAQAQQHAMGRHAVATAELITVDMIKDGFSQAIQQLHARRIMHTATKCSVVVKLLHA